MSKLLAACREKIKNFPACSVPTQWRILRKMGFRYTKRTSKRQLYEQSNVIADRGEYLRAVRAFREEGRPIVFLDETWCNQHHTTRKVWQLNECAPRDTPAGKEDDLSSFMLDTLTAGFQMQILSLLARKAQATTITK